MGQAFCPKCKREVDVFRNNNVPYEQFRYGYHKVSTYSTDLCPNSKKVVPQKHAKHLTMDD